MAGHLTSNRYGKHRVRVSKVRRPRQGASNTEQHELVEVAVNVELEGGFEAAFTDGDNSAVIATDTCKNTVYVLAKDDPLDSIEAFGITIARHFVGRYAHVSRCVVSLEEQVWSRLKECPHAFSARDRLTPTAVVSLERDCEPVVTAGLEHLTIAKTTENGFACFHHDEFRTLADTDDRIFATELSASWRYTPGEVDYVASRTGIVNALLARFVDHYSRSVQETLYFMGQAAIDACPSAAAISLTMPNKHHILADLTPFDRENKNEVFVVTDEPFGYITGTIVRE